MSRERCRAKPAAGHGETKDADASLVLTRCPCGKPDCPNIVVSILNPRMVKGPAGETAALVLFPRETIPALIEALRRAEADRPPR